MKTKPLPSLIPLRARPMPSGVDADKVREFIWWSGSLLTKLCTALEEIATVMLRLGALDVEEYSAGGFVKLGENILEFFS